MKHFDALVRDILRERWESSPVTATLDGVTGYDDRLDVYDPSFRLSIVARRKRFLMALDAIPDDELDPARRMDKRVLETALTTSVRDIEVLQFWRRNPCVYLQTGLLGIYLLLARDDAPAPERAAAAARRTEALPRLLHEGKRNIRMAPRTLSELALCMADGGRTFLRDELHPFLDRHAPTRADAVVQNATQALEEFMGHLRGTWLSAAAGDDDFAVGRDAYELILSDEHLLPYDAGHLVEMGEQARRNVVAELEETAARLDRDRAWPEVLRELKGQRLPDLGLLQQYRDEVERAGTFLREHGLVSVPAAQRVDIGSTPAFLRPLLPVTGLLPAAPFAPRQHGLLYVTVPEDENAEAVVGHAPQEIPLAVLRHALPGRHLQFVVANGGTSAVRKAWPAGLMVEGWGAYAEQMMLDAGYFPGIPGRLFLLRAKLLRALRVVLDVRLHAGDMSTAAAEDYLVQEGHVDREVAAAEVRRCCASPGYGMSAYMGMHEIMRLRRELEMRSRNGLSLRRFHDRLLSLGHVPVTLARDVLLQDPTLARAA